MSSFTLKLLSPPPLTLLLLTLLLSALPLFLFSSPIPAKQWQPWRRRNFAPTKKAPPIILFVSSHHQKSFFFCPACFFCAFVCVRLILVEKEERIFFFWLLCFCFLNFLSCHQLVCCMRFLIFDLFLTRLFRKNSRTRITHVAVRLVLRHSLHLGVVEERREDLVFGTFVRSSFCRRCFSVLLFLFFSFFFLVYAS